MLINSANQLRGVKAQRFRRAHQPLIQRFIDPRLTRQDPQIVPARLSGQSPVVILIQTDLGVVFGKRKNEANWPGTATLILECVELNAVSRHFVAECTARLDDSEAKSQQMKGKMCVIGVTSS